VAGVNDGDGGARRGSTGAFELAIVGGGNMGAALVGGMLESTSFEPAQLAIVEVVDERRAQLTERFPAVAIEASVPPCVAAVLAVKPPDVPAAAMIAAEAGARRLLSIAAGVRLATIEAAAGDRVVVVRAMPNTPALVGQGASAIAAGTGAGHEDLAWASRILSAVGIVEEVPESLLDAFTGVAGSGPAYVFFVAEALIDAAVDEGMPRPMAARVVAELLRGSSTLLHRDGDPRALREMVTSPGGTTAAGVHALEGHDVRAAFAAAVRAATERSRELG
jgi:pyrroline-5-carboxylate reductase